MIPTIVDNESSQTGSVGPQATPADMGVQVGQGLEELGAGMEHGARMAARGARLLENKAAFAKRLDDSQWAQRTYEQQKLGYNTWAAGPADPTKPDGARVTESDNFAGLSRKYTDDASQAITPDHAPSPQAYAMLQQNWKAFSDGKFVDALQQTYKNKVNQAIGATGDSITDAMNAYRVAKGVPGQDGLADMADSVSHIGQAIETNFREAAPDLADKLHEKLISSAVMATMDDSPSAAKSILASNPHLDEQLRFRLGREINSAQQSQDLTLRDSFDNNREAMFKNGEAGQQLDKVPIEEYQQFHPTAQAAVLKQQDDRRIDMLNRANDVLDKVSPLNATSQLKTLSSMRDSAQGNDRDVYDYVARQVQQNLRVQDENPVGWLQKYNPQVQQLFKQAQDAPDSQRLGAIKSLNDATLKYQGMPPEGATDKERAFYLGKPMNDQHLMGLDEAQQMASQLNISTPKEVVKGISEMMARYPDDQQQAVAFNDLVTMGKLKQEYQAVWLNKDAYWVDNLTGALSAGGNIKLPETQYKEVEKYVDADPNWKKFQAVMVGDNYQGSRQISGFKYALQKMSEGYVAQGMSTRDASAEASKLILSTKLGFPVVNGRPMMMLRDRGPALPPRSDEDIRQIGNQLGDTIANIHPDDVSTANFPLVGSLSKDTKADVMRSAVQSRGFWQTAPDGKSASLYYRDDAQSFQLQSKNGKPFTVDFSDLENLTPEDKGHLSDYRFPPYPGEDGYVAPQTPSFVKH